MSIKMEQIIELRKQARSIQFTIEGARSLIGELEHIVQKLDQNFEKSEECMHCTNGKIITNEGVEHDCAYCEGSGIIFEKIVIDLDNNRQK